MPRARTLIAAVAAASLPSLALVAPAAAAHAKTTSTGTTAAATKPAGKKKGHPARIAYVVRGTLSADATGSSASVRVTGENPNATRGLGRLSTITATIGPKTHITKRGMGKAAVSDLKTGDRVAVTWKVARHTALAKLPAASRITDRGASTSMHKTKTTTTTTKRH